MTNEQNTIVTPSYNPANSQSLEGLLDYLETTLLIKLEKIAPAQILDYNRQKNRATIQVLNQSIYSTGEKKTQKPISDIPVLVPYGGNFYISFPIKKGDIGWIVAADRNISLFKQFLSIFTPATYRLHKYEDGFFIPNKINNFNISDEDAEALLITSLDGSTKISVTQGKITMSAPEVIINSQTTINSNAIINGTLTADVVISKNGATGSFSNSVTSQDGIVTAGS